MNTSSYGVWVYPSPQKRLSEPSQDRARRKLGEPTRFLQRLEAKRLRSQLKARRREAGEDAS
jgi:hypothetical protein